MFRTTLVLGSGLIALTLAAGCGSSGSGTTTTANKTAAKKAASGQPAANTTRKPATTPPPPQQKVSSTVGANQSSASKTETACTAEEEGKGVCVDEFIVFCAGGSLYALDCAAAFGGTCGEIDGTLDCLIEE
jgi:hypothetical protein